VLQAGGTEEVILHASHPHLAVEPFGAQPGVIRALIGAPRRAQRHDP